ncbi:CLUMA_CG005418, isoform A [Clunio marinus]|uniref:CLUMA_CG005418, isoform A n=1 Tax=Clunio marinus TaxID=568069 RepID=A0A1J1HUV9_9DIPT|nr:CLUMA_CG005418, isoform A [Clunio marinus]
MRIENVLQLSLCLNAFTGYGIQREQKNCIYKTTSSDYGYFTPTPYSIPTRYYPLNQQFTSHLAQTGMYRNYSLNTNFDKPFCNQF